MSKEPQDRKKFKDTKVVQFLKEKYPDIAKTALELASNIPGLGMLDGVADMIKGSQQIKEEDKQVAIQLLKEDQEEYKLYLADLDSARKWYQALQNSEFGTAISKIVPPAIDIVIVLTWTILTFFIAAKYLNLVDSGNTVNMDGIWGLYAAVTGMCTTIVGFYRGSSKGSKDKDLIEMVKR